MIVTLPSGHRAPLEPADLARLLSCGGSRLELCRAVWAHPDLDAVQALSCAKDDSLYIAHWAIDQFLATEEAAELAAVCEEFHDLPSRRLGMTDRALAFIFDQGCVVALARYREEHTAKPEPQFNSPGSLNDT
jgi:hypothetical protein